MIREDCWLKEKCNHCDCDTFCMRNYKLGKMYDDALISMKQRKYIPLVLDKDQSDLNAFIELSKLEKDVVNFVKNGDNLYLHSNNCGNGKTSWALRLIQSYFNRTWLSADLSKTQALFINVPSYLIQLKNNITSRVDYIEHIKHVYLDADLIVWDEIGSKSFTTFEHENILNMINARIDLGKANIYTSNLSEDELHMAVGDRLYSRIVNNSKNIVLVGKDKRGLQYNMYGYIYKVTNLINDKIYIGKKELPNFDPTYYGSGVIVKQAIKKYGIDNFKLEVIDWCESADDLNSKEIYWIEQYKSQDRTLGYNIAFGGNGGNTLQYRSEESNLLRNQKISETLKGHTESIESKQKRINTLAEYYSDELNIEKRKKINRQRYEDDPTLADRISSSQIARYQNNPELRANCSELRKQAWKDPNYREKQKQARQSPNYLNKMHSKHNNIGKVRINNGEKEKLIAKSDIESYIAAGWVLGRIPYSEETKQKMREAALAKHNNK